MSRREKDAQAASAAQPVAAPQDAEASPVNSTAHLTMPAVSFDPNVDAQGNLVAGDEVEEAKLRRAYLTHPNPPDDLVTDLKGTTVGDIRRRDAEARSVSAAASAPALANTETTSEVLAEREPVGAINDPRRIELVRSKTVTTSDAPAPVTGATMFATTVAPPPPEQPVQRSGESLDAASPSTPATVASSTPSTAAPAPSSAPTSTMASSSTATSNAGAGNVGGTGSEA